MGIEKHVIGWAVAAVFGSVLAGQASVQDRWAGFYGGVSVDAVETTAQVDGSTVHDYKDKTANLGFYLGHNYVRGGGFVWGPEVSLTAISTAGSATDATLGDSNFDGGFLLTPRLRAGYATDRMFFYGILGLGITDVNARPTSETGTDITISPSIGLGAEFAINDQWSTKLEAVHHKFEGAEFDFNGTRSRTDNALTQITLGISRKF